MGSVLAVDDIEIGQFVAVHSYVQEAHWCADDETYTVPRRKEIIPLGTPIRVKGISLPFIACELIAPEGKASGPVIVDVRRVRVCKLNGEYVAAIINTTRSKPIGNRDADVPF